MSSNKISRKYDSPYTRERIFIGVEYFLERMGPQNLSAICPGVLHVWHWGHRWKHPHRPSWMHSSHQLLLMGWIENIEGSRETPLCRRNEPSQQIRNVQSANQAYSDDKENRA